jgi:hypothetical protein
MTMTAERTWLDVDRDMNEAVGQLNALHGRIVALLAEGLALGSAETWASTTHWVAWQAGLSRSAASALALLAERADELPATIGRLCEGRLSLDQAAPIARHAPTWAEDELSAMAEAMTPAQVSRCARLYRAADEPDPANDAGADPGSADVPEPPADAPGDPAVEPSRFGAWFDDDGRFVCRGNLAVDDGVVVDAALRVHYDALWNEWKRRHPAEPALPQPTWADAFVRMAERSLDVEAAERPHAQRCKVLVHVDLADDHAHAHTHLGAGLPAGIWRWLACDATWQAVFEREGVPLGVGRARSIPERLRLAVEHRDGGCRVPGCGARYVQIHHVHHHGREGPTETWNLIALCPRHHRLHHLGRLAIHGTDADRLDGIRFIDQLGRTLGMVRRPRPPSGTEPPPTAARYRPPEGGRLDLRWVSPVPPWRRIGQQRPPGAA